MFLLSLGAGIENFLLGLSTRGVGSAWVSSTLFCPDVARTALELPAAWQPMGAVAVGFADPEPDPRPPRQPREYIADR
jgi:coenzyme F420-0:L-glutamate ligase/coenzyme F420-1:gamma-L-glutamate ligase